VKNINDNIDNVKASGSNVVVAKNTGTGITTDGQFEITVTPLNGSNATTYKITASASMQELADNINKEAGVAVKASINDQGKLVLSNDNGQTITVKDGSATTSTYDGGSGFLAESASYAGFLKLESKDGSPIRIERGNKALATPGTLADLKAIGFREVTSDTAYANDAYTTTGDNLTSTAVGSSWAQNDLKINGVAIYNTDIKTDSFQGKLDAINNFASKTGVQASAYFDKSYAIDATKLIAGNKVKINGVEVELGADIAATVSNINDASAKTGLVATANGNNIKLTGSNVQAVTMSYVDPNVANELALNSRSAVGISAASSGMDRIVDLGAAGITVVAGREYELTISASGTTTVSYTAKAGESAGDVANGLRMQLLATTTYGTGVAMTALAVSGMKLTLGGSVGVGQAMISLHVVNTPTPFGGSVGADATSYGAIKLNSTTDKPISVQLGDDANADAIGLLEMNVGAADFQVNASTMGVAGGSTIGGMAINTADSATKAITTIDNAIEKVSKYRSELGAMENRLNATVNNLSNVVTNTQASRSRIQDTDYASETTALAKAQIISQAATAMLAQANQQPQSVLSLLK
jgi:flagellin-like hook-associated protein FlgL